jgi:hypothetical protein
MEEHKILNEFSKLPPEAQKEVEDFIAFLLVRHSKQPASVKRINRSAFEKEPFIGIWRNREDMRDSRSWVRNTRKLEWGEPCD